ncbi:M23 family metallopeptidase [Methylobacterium sp. SyP6R]|uniref:M23 family metallopeptidase n=1 Tax=Methylobacterium sp. SyP6R TaxID=2718876 RepID=UPI001F46F176|nr:M23 family metallopeptidase [Methylobacterium sp. SyP6R]MCF4130144.1 M23 family metallopeptidase [Methylobacterium sp. SyP6R]
MIRAAASVCGLIALGLSHVPASAGTCLTADIMSPGGQRVSSPYGVNRTGRPGASAGYHQGMDIVNSQGAGTRIFSGSSGPVRYYNFTGGGIIADVTSGDTRFLYLHMNTTALSKDQSGQVAAGDDVGTMGCKGMKSCAPHLHLGALLRGNALSASGASGRAWKMGTGKGASPMTGDAIKAALPAAWYYVNPERFLPRQIPISTKYPDMEGGPRDTTLPRTCAPGANDAAPSETVSRSDTQSRQASISAAAEHPAGSEDHAVKVANQPNRSLFIELARTNATELTANTFDYDAQTDAALAQLVALYALDARPVEARP